MKTAVLMLRVKEGSVCAMVDTGEMESFVKVIIQVQYHFYEMKGDVGMSSHEKEREQEDAHQDRKSFITPSLHLCFAQHCCFICYNEEKTHYIIHNTKSTIKKYTLILYKCVHKMGKDFESNKYVGMGKYERVSAGTVSNTKSTIKNTH